MGARAFSVPGACPDAKKQQGATREDCALVFLTD